MTANENWDSSLKATAAMSLVVVPLDLMQKCAGWTGIASRWNLTEDTLAKLEILHHDLNRELLKAPIKDGARAGLCKQLQQKCYDWGTYWRAPDAHGVNLSREQALELLRDVLGVEVEIAE